MSLRRPLAMAAVLCTIALPAGCGAANQRASTAAPSGAAPAPTAATVRTARCNLWQVLAPVDRRRLLLGLRGFFGGRVDSPGARGQILPDTRAYTFLTGYCSRPYASAFLLYRLYGDAAAFTARQPPVGG